VSFTGAFADYTVLIESTGITITDKVVNRDGVDQVVNVERFLFSDGEYKVNAAGTGLGVLSPEAAQVLDLVQGSGYTDSAVGLTYEFTEENMGDWLDDSGPLLVFQGGGGTNDGDNSLVYSVQFTPGSGSDPGFTTLSMQFDMNSAVGQIQPSDLIELTFPGDVRSSLVPESLTYSG
jgi:hypothetical protein